MNKANTTTAGARTQRPTEKLVEEIKPLPLKERRVEPVGLPATLAHLSERNAPDNKVKHTPGPWRTEGELDSLCVIVGDYSLIGEIHTEDINPPRYEEAAANARLIAAAPELLQQLKDVASDLAHGTTGRWKGKGSEVIRELIAKAEGK